MRIVQIMGGIGNAMFRYALFCNLYHKFNDVYCDIFYDYPGKYHNSVKIANIFNIFNTTLQPITDKSLLDKVTVFQENTWPRYNPEVLEKDNVHLCGNWQNVGYFGDINFLRNEFTFKFDLDDKNKEILKDIQNSNSVSIHVRKTDYTEMPGYWFQADWMNYYGMAVNYIAKNIKERPLKFFVFSDDINWCKKNFMIPVMYVENKQEEGWKDMLLMSNCKHNIIANSTFSWWGAWLNKNPNKIVITPKRWYLDNTDSNLITLNNWIKI
jgi:hypothetical protein